MSLLPLDNIHGNASFRETFTIEAPKADEFVSRMCSELLKEETAWEYVSVSDSMPVVLNGMLNYTITITAGILV